MWVKLSLAVAGALMILPPKACAGENVTNRCVELSVPKNAVIARNGKWIELTSKQWQFLRGVYALNPDTTQGLPYGDKAVLARARQQCRRLSVLYRRQQGLHAHARASSAVDPDGRSRNRQDQSRGNRL